MCIRDSCNRTESLSELRDTVVGGKRLSTCTCCGRRPPEYRSGQRTDATHARDHTATRPPARDSLWWGASRESPGDPFLREVRLQTSWDVSQTQPRQY